ncbi:MAG: SDR family NAD(P)-dependent oxidoreductase [Pseudomonadota bacterium]
MTVLTILSLSIGDSSYHLVTYSGARFIAILTTDQTLVLTGMTAGFGQKALELITGKARCKIIVGARNLDAVPQPMKDRVTWVSLDLSSIQSIAAFCETAKATGPIGGMALNAGLSPRALRKTDDGFDLAFQTNYLSHFAMIQAPWDHLTDEVHNTITSSGTYDPAEKTRTTAPSANFHFIQNPSEVRKTAARAVLRV